jgi:hypothetical protein
MLSLPLSLSTSAFRLFASFVLFILSAIIYRLTFHPLARIPGPRLAGISTIWLAYHVRQGKCATWEPELHRKYGPIVRIAPNEVLVCSEEGIRQIYSTLHPLLQPSLLTYPLPSPTKLKKED